MNMRHTKSQIEGAEPIEIRPFATFKQDKAIHERRIEITRIGMASKRIVADYPHLSAWFCLRVPVGREFLVQSDLVEADVTALVPTRKGEKIMKRHRIIPAPTLPVLPGYVLVQCVPSASAIVALRRFKRVLDIVGGADRPFRVPLEFVERFMEKAASGGYDFKPPSPVHFVVGQKVRVIDGPFSSHPGTVTDIDSERGRVKVDVNIFGRPTPVDLEVAQVEQV